ncbi:zinc transporter ZIP9-like isoform X2 [Ambystoma mexicanum]|uniref:zinc transporter ZIP9-like isoform X2 n=1 Tax=Ambystoma mexicanum TaxID=8296 RepID=UPI0037E753BE
MEGLLVVGFISLAMFLGCFLLGLIPLAIKLSEQKLHFVSLLGAGLLCGTALAIIIPEGIELLEVSSRGDPVPCRNIAQNLNVTESKPRPEESAQESSAMSPHFFIGVSLVMGFILMFIVDQIGSYCSYHDPSTGMSAGTSITATLGLVIHAAADGVALGAAVSSSQVSVQVIVFFAVILHKAPAAFGLVTFLMHAGLEKKQIQKHLLAFSLAAPLLAVATYAVLSMGTMSIEISRRMTWMTHAKLLLEDSCLQRKQSEISWSPPGGQTFAKYSAFTTKLPAPPSASKRLAAHHSTG